MSTQWLRLWHDMPNDPKWRSIARASKQPISAVISIFLHVLVNASNATERGRTQGLCSEDIASALDLETEQVDQILDAMQGRVLDGDRVTGWEKRQPIREDNAAERAKAWREAKKQDAERNRTQPNANKRPDTDTDTDKDKELKDNNSYELLVGTQEIPTNIYTLPNASKQKNLVEECPHQAIIDLYHRHLPMGTQVRVWTATRASHLRTRWREDADRQNPEWWERFFAWCAISKFLTGQVSSPGRDPFVISLEWIIAPKNFARILEGKYHWEAA